MIFKIKIIVLIYITSILIGIAYSDAPFNSHVTQKESNISNMTGNASNRPIFFVQITDIHICGANEKRILEQLIGKQAIIDPEPFVSSTVRDIVDLQPAFVVATGDLVFEARGSAPQDILPTYILINRSMQPLTSANISFYPIIGNHDLVGVFNASVKANESGYAKEMFMNIFHQNRTYYSFDQRGYHFIALDPNSYELWNTTLRSSEYRIDHTQMAWLENDLNSTFKPTIIFLHEPTIDLINRDELLSVLRDHNVQTIFSGHWHVNDLLNSGGIPEQVTTAVCGAWWMGKDVLGVPGGYRIIMLNGSSIETFYRYTGVSTQINIIEPSEATVDGCLNIKAQIWSNSPVQSAWVRLDQQQPLRMNLAWNGLWYGAERSINLDGFSSGYCTANVTANDSRGVFSQSRSFKITHDKFTPIGEIIAHWETYLGMHPKIKGYVDATQDLTLIEEGNQPLFRDETGTIPFVMENCPSLSLEENNTQWIAAGQLQMYSNATKSILLMFRDDACPERIET